MGSQLSGFLKIGTDDVQAEISLVGAALARVWRKGHNYSLVLGLKNSEDYFEVPGAIGVIVGPVAGRVSKARTEVSGTIYQMETNVPPDCLHSGTDGIQNQTWKLIAHSKNELVLQCFLEDGMQNLPGNRMITATYAVSGHVLTLEISATSDQDTIFNAASHAYWALDDAGRLDTHTLRVNTQNMCETDQDLIPTGRIVDVSGGVLDFSAPKSPVTKPALDGCYCLSQASSVDLRHALTLTSLKSGISLDVQTNQPGIVLYAGEYLPQMPSPAQTPQIAPFSGLAIEAQSWPDANNHANFPCIVLKAGTVVRQTTQFSLRMP